MNCDQTLANKKDVKIMVEGKSQKSNGVKMERRADTEQGIELTMLGSWEWKE